MKKLFYILLLIVGTSCARDASPLVYSDYESSGGFNYLEDAVEAFGLDTNGTISIRDHRFSMVQK